MRRKPAFFGLGLGVGGVALWRFARKRGAKPARRSVTVARGRAEVEERWRHFDGSATASPTFADAPGGRGTELAVEYMHAPLAGDLGAAAAKLTGNDLATELSDDLRRLKQQVETGEVVRSEGTPDGHLLADHLTQRAAQPLEEAVR